MSSLKVSLSFLDGPVSTIIAKCRQIATSMTTNKNFPVPPISPAGLQSSVDELKLMESKAKAGRLQDIKNRDVALADLNDFILQNAAYVEQASRNNLEILLSSGFDAQERTVSVS